MISFLFLRGNDDHDDGRVFERDITVRMYVEVAPTVRCGIQYLKLLDSPAAREYVRSLHFTPPRVYPSFVSGFVVVVHLSFGQRVAGAGAGHILCSAMSVPFSQLPQLCLELYS